MRLFGPALVALAALSFFSPAQAQNMVIDRGLTEDLPYTAIYPDVMRSIDDGNTETFLTLQYPDALLQCDYFAVPGGDENWSAEAAAENLDVTGIESDRAADFPGFKVSAKGVVYLGSGPALIYEGASDGSPMGVPITLIHTEAVGAGRTYAMECLMDSAIATDARPMIEVMIANFSTRSDGQCCIDPKDDRG